MSLHIFPKCLYSPNRNYSLFAILADVRNEEGYEYIAPRRGIPDNLSPEVKSWHEWPEDIQCSYSRAVEEDEYWNACWTETYAEAAGSDFMELLYAFSQKYGVSKDVRFVFWFT